MKLASTGASVTVRSYHAAVSAQRTVLVVDDDEQLHGIARSFLEKAGFAVDSCTSVDDGLERLRTGEPPSVILLDGILPGKDGGDFLRIMSTDESLPIVPILLMSDLLDLDTTRIPARLNIAGRLDKPFTRDQLVKAVEAATGSGDAKA